MNKSGDHQPGLEFFKNVFEGAWISQGIAVVSELGIADLIAHEPRRVKELAEQTQTHAGALYRVLRALTSIGVFHEDADGRFLLTPIAEKLRNDTTASQRAYAMMMGREFYGAWGELLHSVKTGKPGFQKCFNKPFFQYLLEHPNRHLIYDKAMTAVHGVETIPMLDAYNLTGCRTVVDVGGGKGQLLASLLKRYPRMQGILFELPAVAKRARSTFDSQDLLDRCRVEAGDFFHSVPSGADVYLLRHVIHDWEDAEAIRILRNCRNAMGTDGRLLVVEMVIPPGNSPAFGKWLDLMMLLIGGKERTQDEYAGLFASAGLKLNQVISTTSEVSILEGVSI